MDARAATRTAVGLLIASTLAGCAGGRSVPPNPAGPSTATTHSSGPVTLADAKHYLFGAVILAATINLVAGLAR